MVDSLSSISSLREGQYVFNTSSTSHRLSSVSYRSLVVELRSRKLQWKYERQNSKKSNKPQQLLVSISPTVSLLKSCAWYRSEVAQLPRSSQRTSGYFTSKVSFLVWPNLFVQNARMNENLTRPQRRRLRIIYCKLSRKLFEIAFSWGWSQAASTVHLKPFTSQLQS